MAYCTVDEVFKMLKEDMINSLLADELIEDASKQREMMEPVIEDAIADADAEINGYLTKRYSLPFVDAPKVLNKFSKDIAIYNIISNRFGIDENGKEKTILNRYNAAIKFLTSVANGTIELGITGTKETAATGFKMRSNKRLFSRGTMRGW